MGHVTRILPEEAKGPDDLWTISPESAIRAF
jgi:hypothetical protein